MDERHPEITMMKKKFFPQMFLLEQREGEEMFFSNRMLTRISRWLT